MIEASGKLEKDIIFKVIEIGMLPNKSVKLQE
jgi:hypothetical protein